MPYLDDVLNPYQSLTGDLTPEDTLTGLLSEDGLLQGALAISDVVGVTELTELTDVSITNPLNNDVLTYNDVTEKWENMPAQGGGGGTSDYEDLDNKPSINSVTLTGNQTTDTLGLFSGDYDDLTNKPEFATVATTGSYDDLTDTPTIPAAQVNSDWDAESGIAQILNKPELALVATSGSYDDLTDQPTIPDLSVVEVTSDFTITKISGAWNVASFNAYKSGTLIYIRVRFSGTGTSVSGGSDSFSGTIAGPYIPLYDSFGIGCAANTLFIMQLNNNGTMKVRLINDAYTLGSGVVAAISNLYFINP